MRITFHGAARTVTGSQHLIEINGSSLLLDCGLYQGSRKESYLRNRQFRFDPSRLDAVILSHAHIDHSGNLPNLVKNGYQGPIYTTPATAHLSRIMLLDSDLPPTKDGYHSREWELEHKPNMTGTPLAYRPRGSILAEASGRAPPVTTKPGRRAAESRFRRRARGGSALYPPALPC